MYKKLFSEIDALSEKYLDILEDICNIESPTSHKAGVDAVGDYCIAVAERLGFSAERFAEQISGNAVLITMNPKAPKAPITLSAHMDTVHPIGSFGEPAVKRECDIMHGPGVMDCKGGVAAAMLAMEALLRCGFEERPVKLFLQSDEENSSKTSDKRTIKKMCECAAESWGNM